MRDPAVIDALDALERYARAVDDISGGQEPHYSAGSFVRWVRLEATAADGRADRARSVEAADGSNGDKRTPAHAA